MALEKYQSEFTAEDFENAIRAVPNIGPNGNWFIGENDTGVFAGGVKVEGAEVGQTIVVKAVDENGVPTEWEPAELPAGWEVINEIVTTEETSNVAISTDFDGNPFDLAEGIGFATNPNGLGGNWYMYASPSTEAYVQLDGSKYFVMEYSKLWPVIRGYSYNTGSNSATTRASLVTTPVFNRLRFLNWNNTMMPVGTKIKLIGRRA